MVEPAWDDAQRRSLTPIREEPMPQGPTQESNVPARIFEEVSVEARVDADKGEDEAPVQDEEEYEDDKGIAPPAKLSKGAIQKRLYRIMQPRSDGSFKVPQELLDQYRDPEKRDGVINLFEKTGYEPAGILNIFFFFKQSLLQRKHFPVSFCFAVADRLHPQSEKDLRTDRRVDDGVELRVSLRAGYGKSWLVCVARITYNKL